jgi:hypothetical protein
MATAESIVELEWLVRTFAPNLLTSIGLVDEADSVRGTQTLNTQRLNTAANRMKTLEDSVWLDHTANPGWEIWWPEASQYVRNLLISQRPNIFLVVDLDPDPNVKFCLKTSIRMLSIVVLAQGGVLP